MVRRRPLAFDPIELAREQWVAHGWPAAAPGMAAVTSIMRAQQLYLARVEAVLRPFGLTFARYELLMLLSFSRTGAMPLSRVGARLQVHPTSVTNLVDRLERQRLVERLPHPTDRRTTLAAILPAGRDVAEKATAALNEEVFEAPGLDEGDLRDLFAILRRLRVASGDIDPAPEGAPASGRSRRAAPQGGRRR
ncbi:MAG TPA: MarR family transcriptional regulator [Acidimicrobiales bacterium]|nr:MarR family transcriptional regulator [Acidimicrobiales bacterium]